MLQVKNIFLVFSFGALFLLPVTAHAVDFKSQLGAAAETGAGYDAASAKQDPRLIVTNIIKIALSFVGILFLIMILYAGFTIMTARGEEDKVEKGKKTLGRAVLGLVVIMSAYSITLLAQKIATGDAKHQGDYIEIKDRDVDFQRGNVPHAETVGCPYGLVKNPDDGSCSSP